MSESIRILLVEDRPLDAELVARALHKAGVGNTIERVDTAPAFLEKLKSFEPDIILSDYSMPNFAGCDALVLAREHAPHVPFVFLSGTIGEEIAIESLRSGAVDYILKNNMGRLATAIERALRDAREKAIKENAERELRRVQERFALFMQHLPGPAFIKTIDGRLQFVNRAFERMASRSSDEIIGRTNGDIWPQQAAIYDANDAWVRQHNHVLQAFETYSGPGGDRCYLMHKFPIPDSDGRPAMIGGAAVDFTARLEAEQKLARLSRIHRVLSGINSTIVRVRDRGELLREACRIAVEHGGFRFAWVGLGDGDATPAIAAYRGLDAAATGRFLEGATPFHPQGIAARAIREGAALVINDLAAPGNAVPPLPGVTTAAALPLPVEGRVSGALVLYAAGSHVFDDDEMKLLSELAGDISYALEYIDKNERLDYFAYYDPLTDLPNRSLFADRVSQLVHAHAADAPQRVAVAVVDVERFALVNDTLGRQAGDTLLKLVAARLRDAVQGSASIARLGADTFAIAVPDVRDDANAARLLAEFTAAVMGEPYDIGTQELRVAFKCGVAIHPGDGDDAESLLKNAEAALKNAKASGERYMFYASQMKASVAGILLLESRLRKAIAADEFILHYQPKIELATGHVDSLEALIRWQSPDEGLVSPAQFVPMLEETGLIVDVGLWVLRQAVADQQRWASAGYGVPRVSVNVSAKQLRQKDFVASAIDAVRGAGGDLAAIDLEITETVIMDDIAQYVPKLQALRDAGMGVEIDDFGTGYSSLAYIGRLPLSAMKIDRSFVSAMTEVSDNVSIVSTIISLAHQLGLRVVAEGVETPAQRDLLASMGCDLIQGYLVSRPQPFDAVSAFLAAAGAGRGAAPGGQAPGARLTASQ
jgi:diguanylate cyclase (GGDEF)-like protein/PAS domain S-box-containing protein